MNAKDIKSKITEEHILILLQDFGVEYKESTNDNELIFRTICHNGDSEKLYFYRDSLNFHCYTNCGSMDILKLIQNILNVDLQQAIMYIANRFNFKEITYLEDGFNIGSDEINCDWELINRFNNRSLSKNEKWKEFNIIEFNILNLYYDFYHKSFLEDNISIETMKKYKIMYDIFENRIIIPHFNLDNQMIAIRCRNLEEELINTGRKYMPIIYKNRVLSAPTGQYFYGLNNNIKAIKKTKKVILLESEKAVMQMDTMFNENNISLALSSSNLSNFQINILKELGVDEVIIGLDKEYHSIGSIEEKKYFKRLYITIIERLLMNGFRVSILWDYDGYLDFKNSPTDKGIEIFLKLYKNRHKKMTLEGIR